MNLVTKKLTPRSTATLKRRKLENVDRIPDSAYSKHSGLDETGRTRRRQKDIRLSLGAAEKCNSSEI